MDSVVEKKVGVDESYRSDVKYAVDVEQVSTRLDSLVGCFGYKNSQELFGRLDGNSKVLMLGSGEGDLLNDIRNEYPALQVIDLNPAFVDTGSSEREKRKLAVAAFNPELPFKTETFDLIIDKMASVWYARYDSAKAVKRVEEIVRVLKDGRKALVGPSPLINREAIRQRFENEEETSEIKNQLSAYFIIEKRNGKVTISSHK